ncbi:MAG: hypothetical protein QG635_915 [Bacteroidota bacterium]|nr:hypothetical protein [Bacteroidota bacterium]
MKDLRKYSDGELISLIREKSDCREYAFYILYQKYSPKLLSFCLFKSTCIEEAEEILQDTWLKFHKAVTGGRELRDILPYLYLIARNLCIDRFRSRSAGSKPAIDYFDMESIQRAADPFNFQSDMDKEELAGLVNIAINNLDEIYKETLVLYWHGCLTYEQIAEVCGETTACIRTRFSRGVKQLVSILKPYIIELTK